MICSAWLTEENSPPSPCCPWKKTGKAWSGTKKNNREFTADGEEKMGNGRIQKCSTRGQIHSFCLFARLPWKTKMSA